MKFKFDSQIEAYEQNVTRNYLKKDAVHTRGMT